jgi:ppGpp synthetase/RelA/SpoT-type nucleotidyltranferase
MNFKDYERSERQKYAQFASVVLATLRAALDVDGRFSLWSGKHRAKECDSLRKKLKVRKLLNHSNIEQKIKDLAGCRLVFYSNDDVDRFIQSGIVPDNFTVDWDQSKVHHPIADTDDVAELYRAHHYLVTLTPERLALAEYARFAGLRCEIQIQTILNHAWSETGHDIIYKSAEIAGFGGRLGNQIKARMANIMKTYLVPAGYEFQKMLHDYARLKQGREFFDRKASESIENAADNNERHEALERYRDFVVPNYDDLAGVIQEILDVTRSAIEAGRTVATKPITTPFGEFEGKKPEDVADVALDIIERVRYVDRILLFAACMPSRSPRGSGSASWMLPKNWPTTNYRYGSRLAP